MRKGLETALNRNGLSEIDGMIERSVLFILYVVQPYLIFVLILLPIC